MIGAGEHATSLCESYLDMISTRIFKRAIIKTVELTT